MRHSGWGWLAVLFVLLTALPAAADTVVIGNTTYVYPGDVPAIPTYALSVQGVSLHPESMETVTEPWIPGAVFGIYARSGGGFVPFPDPADPSKPLILTSQASPLHFFLPNFADLYIKQESAPEGYLVGESEGVYTPLTQPCALTFVNLREGMQGVRVFLAGNGPGGSVPLAGVRFRLAGQGQSIFLVTDGMGKAQALLSAPGEYTLTQMEAPEGYRMERPEVTVLVAKNTAAEVFVRNNQDGALTLRTLGMAADSQGVSRLVAINRRYEVFGEDGVPWGFVSSGGALALPAVPEGARYTLRGAEAPTDGFAADAQTHEALLYPGRTTECQTIVPSEMGFFTFAHVSTEGGGLVPGGAFTLLNGDGSPVLQFEADAEGKYASGAPLLPGQYTIAMTYAGDKHLYDAHTVSFVISPYLAGEGAVAEVKYGSRPLPPALLSPTVTTVPQAHESLFLSAAEIDFTLALERSEFDLPVEGLTFGIQKPGITGITWLEERPDGGRLQIARRFMLADVEEVRDLTVKGTVRYTFRYPVAPDSYVTKYVSAPFAVLAAAFAPIAAPPAYAVSGHVTDAEGGAMPGVPVSLVGADGLPLEETVTDPYGAYAFPRLPEGSRVVFHPAEGFGALAAGWDAVLLPYETVQGVVSVHGPLEAYPVLLSIGSLAPQVPDKDGRFAFSDILLSKETLSVETPQGVLWRVEERAQETVVHLYPAASLSGIVTDPQGRPIAGAEIILMSGGVRRATLSGGDGRYCIDGLFPGLYSLAVSPPKGFILNGGVWETLTIQAGISAALDASVMEPAVIEGALTTGDSPLMGIEVSLEPTLAVVITDENGRFAFTQLPTGSYALRAALPEGMVTGPIGPIALTESGQRVSLDLIAVYPVTLTGLVWQDTNDDGLLSPEEPGLEGAEVALLDADQRLIASERTARGGGYTFAGLLPGTYHIRVTLPENMIFSKPAPNVARLLAGIDSHEAVSGPITVRSGDKPDPFLCGATMGGRVSGFVWEDTNATGLYDAIGDPPLAGVAVTLVKDGAACRETTTDASGAYAYDALRTGDYTLRMALPEGYLFAEQPMGEGVKSDMSPTLEPYAEKICSLRTWRREAVVNAGMVKAAALSGFIWIDMDADGNYWNEAGCPGVAVALYRIKSGRETLAVERETDPKGAFAFERLRPGEYRLSYKLPEPGWGYTVGEANQFLSLKGGAAVEVKAAVSKLGIISGLVFADTNYDGYRSEGAPGLAATVRLIDPASGKVLRQAKAEKDGSYAFDSLFAGRYVVRFELEEGYYFTRYQGDAPSYSSNVPETAGCVADTATLYLPMGETLLVDAGAYKTGAIAGNAWHDAGNSGVYAEGNPPLAGIPITLLRSGAPCRETQTDAEGSFLFSGLPPGTYAVAAALPDGMGFSLPPPPGAKHASMITAVEGAAGETGELVLAMGARIADVNIGAVFLGEIRGEMRSALNNATLPSVVVTLIRNGEIEAALTTDGNGDFCADGVRPGPVEVTFDPPPGWVIGPDAERSLAVEVPQGGAAVLDTVMLMPEAVITGSFWMDEDGDGIRGGQEAPLAGPLVTLVQQVQDTAMESTSVAVGEDGVFRFDALTPGTYSLRLDMPEGFFCHGGGATEPLPLVMGELRALEFGAFVGASVSGIVWEDINNNGLYEEGEPLLEGVAVTLLDKDGSVLRETVTGASGVYRFEALPPLRGAVAFTPLEGYTRDDEPSPILLPMGGGLVVSAPFLRYGRIGDLVWLDVNGNGLQETSEPGVPGVIVTLYGVQPGGDLLYVANTVTDAHGRYRFSQVPPGLYQVTFYLEDYLPTKTVDTLPEINSKLSSADGKIHATAPFPLGSGERRLAIDAGVVTREMAESFGWK